MTDEEWIEFAAWLLMSLLVIVIGGALLHL
jgi:hypothetical protein